MKPRESLVRLKLFQVKEKRRQLGQLDLMIGEFERMAGELDAQILSEEKKAGITDINHFAYPTFAKAARQRRDNLFGSIRDLMSQKEDAEAELIIAEADLTKAEALEERDGGKAPREVIERPINQRRAMIG
ncbi:flagellar export protein FliJ [Brucella thiophenivorans]|uniref:Putative flagellar export protein FliJ n=1 Tax=Brucella thiophenivorans TaxID=571255 RepID=A0A256G3H8_9HYPH|nr:flagellar export protein FliJ [Brucella thiophenivorans]OYR21665.1 putative flagellar export protein FliJ [Brucella thiophenivorans]